MSDSEDQALNRTGLGEWLRKHHVAVSGYVFGFIGLISLYYSLANVEPYYRVGQAETLARRDSPRLTITWDGKPVESLCLCRITLWNGGRVPLTVDRLSDADPLRIVSSTPVEILSVEQTNSSRASLAFETKLVPDATGKHRSVLVGFRGRDALDTNDGGVFKVLFTGDCNDASLSVAGRVIGTAGFRYVGLKNSGIDLAIVAGLILMMLAVIVLCLSIFEAIDDWLRKHVRQPLATIIGIVSLLSAILASSAFGMITMMYATTPRIPSWAGFERFIPK